MARVLWPSDEEWAAIEPHLPRGRRGARRVDDRRVISGIVHMLKTGARWRDCPAEYGPYTTIYNRFNRWCKQGVWEDVFYVLTGSSGVIGTTSGQHPHQGAPLGQRRKRGDFAQAIGRSRGGRTTNHAITDELGRPLALCLTPGQAHDLTGVGQLLTRIPTPRRLLADRAYDAKRLRDWLAERGCEAVIPPNPTRNASTSRTTRSPTADRNPCERMFCRLKDFRRIATRYDNRADAFLSAVFLVAAVVWWAKCAPTLADKIEPGDQMRGLAHAPFLRRATSASFFLGEL